MFKTTSTIIRETNKLNEDQRKREWGKMNELPRGSPSAMICAFVLTILIGVSVAMTNPGQPVTPSDETTVVTPTDWRVLYYYVPLYKSRADANADLVDALRSPGVKDFTHVMLTVPSWYEFPYATEHPLVKHAVNLLDEQDVPFYWCRLLWPAWSSAIPPDIEWPEEDSYFRPEYYSTAIATVRAEARQLGAIGCGFDAELYGNDPIHKALRAGLTEHQQRRMEWAVRLGVRSTGRANFIEPCGYPGNHVNSYVWPLCDLGEIRATTSTYYDTTVASFRESDRFPTVPNRYKPWTPKLWGIHLGDGVTGNGTPLITRDQLDAMDWDAIRTEYPFIRGSFIYIGLNKRAEALRKWVPG